jgi:hypothetical protein
LEHSKARACLDADFFAPTSDIIFPDFLKQKILFKTVSQEYLDSTELNLIQVSSNNCYTEELIKKLRFGLSILKKEAWLVTR